MMLLLVLLAFDAPSSDYLAKRLTYFLVKLTEWLLESSNRLKQSRILDQPALDVRALCSSQQRHLTIW